MEFLDVAFDLHGFDLETAALAASVSGRLDRGPPADLDTCRDARSHRRRRVHRLTACFHTTMVAKKSGTDRIIEHPLQHFPIEILVDWHRNAL